MENRAAGPYLVGMASASARVRALPSAPGDSTARLCIRDLSMNGTGHKRPDGKPPVHLDKRVDTPLQDGSVILVPMLLKVTQDSAARHGVAGTGCDNSWNVGRVSPVSGRASPKSPKLG